MKVFFFILLTSLLFACNEPKVNDRFSENVNTPDLWFPFSEGDFSKHGEFLYYKDEKLNGFIYVLRENKKDTSFYTGYLNGLLHGKSKKWYSNLQVKEIRNYKMGKKHGLQLSYWENGNKRFQFTAFENQYEGTLKEWDIEGKLTHLGNFKNGQEEGEQKMWNSNGKIRSNYIIKDGRRYGLLGTKNCTNVTDSISFIR